MKSVNDILKITEESLAIETIAGKINSFRNVSIERTGARIFKDNKIFTGSIVGKSTKEDLIKKTEAQALVGIDYNYELPKNKNYHYVSKNFSDLDKKSFMEEVQAFESDELGFFSNEFVFTGKHKVENIVRELESSEGVHSVVKQQIKTMSYNFKKIGSPNLMDGFFYTIGSESKIRNTFKAFKPYLEMFNKEVKIADGEYPVLIVDGEASYYSKLLESFLPHKYFEGTALFSGKIGEKLFHQDFSLIDHAFLPEHGIVSMCDKEGVLRDEAQLYLIENGVMKNIISDLRYANKYKIKPTGNGQRNFDTTSSVGFNAVTMKPGKRSVETILKDLDKCIVAFMAFGGDFTDKGDYSTPIHLGYLVEKGKIIGKIPQVTMTTTIQKMFNESFIEIANNEFFESNYHPSFFHKVNILNN